MSPGQSSRVVLAYCGTFVAAVGFVALLASFGAGGIEKAGATPIESRSATPPVSNVELAGTPKPPATSDVAVANVDAATVKSSVTADTTAASDEPKPVAVAALPELSKTLSTETAAASTPDPAPHLADKPQVPATNAVAVASVDVATVTSSVTEVVADTTAASDEPKPLALAALPDQSKILPAETAAVSTPDPAPHEVKAPASKLEIPDECLVADICIDQYLWALYQRAPKQDTNKVHERRKVTVFRKGKKITVTRRFVTLVDADFTWKDPIAAQRVGMPLMKYVIGGMDRSFKRKLLYMLLAAEEAGLSPGITSAFRDDYRQSIATGQKAASNRSYHGGSLRGGYGHGLAADVVSVKGTTTRSQRWVHNVVFWKWIDEHGKAYGIGRPYLDRDAPHVAPIDGREYATHYRPPKVQQAKADKKQPQLAAADGVMQAAQRAGTLKIVATNGIHARRDE